MPDAIPALDSPSKPPLRFRRTRIAVSVFFGVLAIGTGALWMRSYYRWDQVAKLMGYEATRIITSNRGKLTIIIHDESRQVVKDVDWQHWYRPSSPDWYFWNVIHYLTPDLPVFESYSDSQSCVFVCHYWLLMFIFASIALIVWRPTTAQFSLRTMFIATTLVAVALGLCMSLKG